MPKKAPRTKARKTHKLFKISLLAALLLTLMALPLNQTTPPAAAEEAAVPMRQARSVLYVMDSPNLHLRDGDAPALDQLNYSFALIKDGKADGSHWMGLKKVQSYLRKHPHIDGVLAVGGWGAEGFSDACLTEEGRRILAGSILSLMDQCGFVGVDIDWEYPGVAGTGIVTRDVDVENWYALLGLLREGLDAREALHGREYRLSVALGAGESALSVIDPARLAQYVDQAVVMAYDLKGFDRMTGHHAGLYPGQNLPNTGDWAVQQLLQAGFPAEKILLGMPAYGRVWRQVHGGGDGLNQRADTSGNKTIPFNEVLALEKSGSKRYYDDIAQAAWWFDGTNFVSAEDDRSIQRKGDYVKQNALQGIAVWQYTQDPDGSLLAMLDAALR